jgi:hypothetical protein
VKDASDAPDGFLSRWSRRKAVVRKGEAPLEKAPAAEPPPAAATSLPVGTAPAAAPKAAPAAEDKLPAPTLDEVAQLTPGSDFRRFVASNAAPEVRNAALKKLFADPHFNVMDGLDIYIDDYNKFEPLTQAHLKLMAGARALGLIDDQDAQQPQPEGAKLAADNVPAAPTPTDEDADLQLQPDDAAGQPSTGQGVAERADPDGPAPDPVPPRST